MPTFSSASFATSSEHCGEIVTISCQKNRLILCIHEHHAKNFFENEIIRLSDSGTGAVQHELKKLLTADLISAQSFGNQIRYQANTHSPLFNEEIMGLVHSGKARLKDAGLEFLSEDNRFDLAYNAARSIALAALRLKGYRASNRYVVFQALPFTLDVGPEVWRILSKCHDKRNLAEYEGLCEMDTRLLKELITAAHILLEKIDPILKNVI